MNHRITVIIPTYNRPAVVRRALDSFKEQTLASEQFAVIVVDDGSTEDCTSIKNDEYPFAFLFLRQDNQGATKARNSGAEHATSELLIFMDDDVTLSPTALERMVDVFPFQTKSIVMGSIQTCYDGDDSPYANTMLQLEERSPSIDAKENASALYEVDPVNCNTEFLAVEQKDFVALGMFQDPTGEWPNWDDVDFGYRAAKQGYRLYVATDAHVKHWDYSLANLRVSAERWRRASRAAVKLFQTHPELREHIPMFHDKFPIQWREDSPKLIARKMARRVFSNTLAINLMENLTYSLEKRNSFSLLSRMYRWVNGAYMYQGVREGLRIYAA